MSGKQAENHVFYDLLIADIFTFRHFHITDLQSN
jgi:hypothetical protein